MTPFVCANEPAASYVRAHATMMYIDPPTQLYNITGACNWGRIVTDTAWTRYGVAPLRTGSHRLAANIVVYLLNIERMVERNVSSNPYAIIPCNSTSNSTNSSDQTQVLGCSAGDAVTLLAPTMICRISFSGPDPPKCADSDGDARDDVRGGSFVDEHRHVLDHGGRTELLADVLRDGSKPHATRHGNGSHRNVRHDVGHFGEWLHRRFIYDNRLDAAVPRASLTLGLGSTASCSTFSVVGTSVYCRFQGLSTLTRGTYQTYINGVSTGIPLKIQTNLASLNHTLCSSTHTFSPDRTAIVTETRTWVATPSLTHTTSITDEATPSTPSLAATQAVSFTATPREGIQSQWTVSSITLVTVTVSLSISLSPTTVSVSTTNAVACTRSTSPTITPSPMIMSLTRQSTSMSIVVAAPSRSSSTMIMSPTTIVLTPSTSISLSRSIQSVSSATGAVRSHLSPTTTLSSTPVTNTKSNSDRVTDVTPNTIGGSCGNTLTLKPHMTTLPPNFTLSLTLTTSSTRHLSASLFVVTSRRLRQTTASTTMISFVSTPSTSLERDCQLIDVVASMTHSSANEAQPPKKNLLQSYCVTVKSFDQQVTTSTIAPQSSTRELQHDLLSVSSSTMLQSESATQPSSSITVDTLHHTHTMMSSKQITAAKTEVGVQVGGVDPPQAAATIIQDVSSAGTFVCCFGIVVVLLIVCVVLVLSVVLRRFWKYYRDSELYLSSSGFVRYVAVHHIYISGLGISCDDHCVLVHAMKCAAHVSITACVFTVFVQYVATQQPSSNLGVDIGWGTLSVVLSFTSIRLLTALVRYYNLQGFQAPPRCLDNNAPLHPSMSSTATGQCQPSTTSTNASSMFDATIDLTGLMQEVTCPTDAMCVVNALSEFATLTLTMRQAPHAPSRTTLPGQVGISHNHNDATKIVGFDDITCLEGNEDLRCDDFIFSDSIDVDSLLAMEKPEQVACNATQLHAVNSATKQTFPYDRRTSMVDSFSCTLRMMTSLSTHSCLKILQSNVKDDQPPPTHEVSLMGWMKTTEAEEAMINRNDVTDNRCVVSLSSGGSCSNDISLFDDRQLATCASPRLETYDSLRIRRWVCTLNIVLLVAAFRCDCDAVEHCILFTHTCARHVHVVAFLITLFVVDACILQPAWIAIVAYWSTKRSVAFSFLMHATLFVVQYLATLWQRFLYHVAKRN
ncbi:transmembrane protein, putative [Bodo saltans]|uniref:Transmembrane protein, putative n=1 Tax=Bodo saltans TaxID=75058 RepID=A0A0S4JVM1_BODSA|nr:transmembrane protein, putative [Bodo saltans]|eukprot:CUG92628.1 transmembrane protein, putative [Bodo saltans]